MKSSHPFSRTCIVALACLGLAFGCSSEEEKPRPDFMSKPASSDTATTPAAEGSPGPDAEPRDLVRDDADSAPTEAEPEPMRQDETRMPTFVIVDGKNSRVDDASDDAVEYGTPGESDHEPDDLALEEEADEEEEEPREEDGTFFYGSTRPFIPQPIDVADPAPNDVAEVAAAPGPSPAQLAPHKPWTPKPQSELDRILAQENVYPTAEELEAMERLGEIPSGPDPTPEDHP